MDVIKKSLFYLGCFCCLVQQAFAEMMEKGRTKFKTVFNFYHQNSNNGNQVYDNSGREEANVFEPMIFVAHQITEDTEINFQGVFDLWTAASDTKIDSYTGASGGTMITGDGGITTQTRGAGNLGVRQEKGKWAYGLNAGFSTEYDYSSINGSLNIARSFAKDNFTLGLGVQYYLDHIRVFPDLTPANAVAISDDQARNIFATSLTATQILTIKDLLQVELTYARASGTLESTASTTLVNGVRETELLPETRSRYAISSKWVHGLSETSAMNWSYRYYFDQWGMQAHTTRYAYLWETNEGDDFYEAAIRYHNQSKVDYYANSFSSLGEYRTSDSDMQGFNSYEVELTKTHTIGEVKPFGLEMENYHWNYGFVYAVRDNGMRWGYLQTSIGVEF